MNYSFIQKNIWLFVVLAVWDLIWKGIALWKAAKNNQRNWFILLLIINSFGIFPIIYLKLFSREKKE
jgi:hypothetical protein